MFDIIAYLEDRGIEWHEGGSENTSSDFISIQCPNPLCNDHLNHCGIHPDDLYFNCWVCGEKGNIKQIVKWIDECSWHEVKSIIKEFQKDSIEDAKPKTLISKPTKQQLPPFATKQFPVSYLHYLKKRKYDPNYLIDKYNLYAVHFIGEYRWRIIVPFYLNGQIVTYTSIHISKENKYKHAEKNKSVIEVKNMLYNIDNCTDSCVIVEGVFDVWRIGDGAIGIMGTKYTDQQLEMLINYFKKVIIAFDEGAEELGYNLAKELSGCIPEVIHIEILRGDPDELPQKEINYIRSLL